MKKTIFLILVIAALLLIFGCTQQQNQIENSNIENNSSELDGLFEELDTPGAESINFNVRIENFSYYPKEVVIKVGDSVSWMNYDSQEHTVTIDGVFDSGLLPKGQSYKRIFNEKGIFEYYCTPHPYMTGKIIVE